MPRADPPGPSSGPAPGSGGSLDRSRCQVGGVNQNYTSRTGTLYHIQVEDRGPVLDRVSEREVRRLSVIVYANYGESNAQIIHGRDHDFPDVRTHEHNRLIEQKVQELAAQARDIIEEKEDRQVARIKALVREYYVTKNEATKKEFEAANAAFPILFSRAWMQLKADKASGPSPAPPPTTAPEVAAPEEVVYPLDPELRERVMEIERLIIELGQDLQQLKAQGGADDILLQTCRKLVSRAKEGLSGREPSEFNVRRLDMTRNSLMTTWRQIKSRLK
ncbi:MAG: hypothetical protein DMF80_10110 [Acidobacteria bacterium]|nr:MAG: hypothetical protein DMF80_10110 [Acidobacteriota bacterium]